jgi:hypothetical protein
MMTNIEAWIVYSVLGILVIGILSATWLCFWRTRIKMFLVLGIFLAILWPLFNASSRYLINHVVNQIMSGETPTFPFSLLTANAEGAGMTAGRFAIRSHYTTGLIKFLTLGILMAFLARSLKRFMIARTASDQGALDDATSDS